MRKQVRRVSFFYTFSILLCVSFSIYYYYDARDERALILELRQAERDVSSVFKEFQVRGDKNQPLPLSLRVKTVEGGEVNLFDGERFTVLNLWATWCSPCLKELPSLKSLSERLGSDWQVLAVSIDAPSHIENIERYVEQYDVRSVAGYYDFEFSLQNSFNPKVLPSTYILNPKGYVLYEIRGDAVWDDAVIISFLKVVGKP